MKIKLLMLLCFIDVITISCQKGCTSDGSINQSFVTQDNWQWFNFPEGNKIAYENNLGEKDTAIFGPINIINERGYHDTKNCITAYNQKIIQDIKWVHELKGRLRPVKLVEGGGSLGSFIEYSDRGHF